MHMRLSPPQCMIIARQRSALDFVAASFYFVHVSNNSEAVSERCFCRQLIASSSGRLIESVLDRNYEFCECKFYGFSFSHRFRVKRATNDLKQHQQQHQKK